MEVKKISEINKEIEELNIPQKEKAIKALISFLISLAVVIGPIILFVNLLIYEQFRGILALGILFMVTLFMVLVQKIYYDSITKKRVQNTNKLIIIPTMVVLFLGLVLIYLMAWVGVF